LHGKEERRRIGAGIIQVRHVGTTTNNFKPSNTSRR